jgi:hypothetical protein
MATELLELQLEELSLVDRPANAEAMVTLFKRDDTQEEEVNKMTTDQETKVKAYMEKHSCGKDEAMKALGYDVEKAEEADPAEELKSEIETLKAKADELSLENERLRKGLIDEGYVIKAEAIEKKAPEEFVEYEGEKINKAEIPAPILKALEAAEIEKADVALTKKAEETLPHFSVDAAKGLLSAVSKMDEVDMLMEALAAADKAFADKMEEFGKADVDGDFSSASDKVEHMVKSHMEENGLAKKDYAKAYAAVAKTEEGRNLIAKAYKGE